MKTEESFHLTIGTSKNACTFIECIWRTTPWLVISKESTAKGQRINTNDQISLLRLAVRKKKKLEISALSGFHSAKSQGQWSSPRHNMAQNCRCLKEGEMAQPWHSINSRVLATFLPFLPFHWCWCWTIPTCTCGLAEGDLHMGTSKEVRVHKIPNKV